MVLLHRIYPVDDITLIDPFRNEFLLAIELRKALAFEISRHTPFSQSDLEEALATIDRVAGFMDKLDHRDLFFNVNNDTINLRHFGVSFHFDTLTKFELRIKRKTIIRIRISNKTM